MEESVWLGQQTTKFLHKYLGFGYVKESFNMPKISIIILNYNGFEETYKLAKSISLWDYEKLDYHVVIVDNCSTDNSFQQLNNCFMKYSRFDVIKSEKNGGYSYGNNFGAKFAIDMYHPDYIIISNPDVEIEESMVVQLIKTFSIDKKIGMCAPVMKSLDGSYSVYSQKTPGYSDDLRACYIFNKPKSLIKKGYSYLGAHSNCIVTEMLPGSFFAIRTDCFIEVGLFDENVFLYCEERIIGWRMKNAGYLAVLRSDLSYIHAHAVTTSKAMDIMKKWKILLSSRLYYQKEYEKTDAFRLYVLKIAMKGFLIQLQLLQIMNNIRLSYKK